MQESKLNTFANIRSLSSSKGVILACTLLQRMLPNYQLFCKATGFGDAELAANILSLIWEKSANVKSKFNVEVQLQKLEEITPDIEDFDNFAVYPALDYCMALSVLLQSFISEHEKPAVTVAKLSQGSVEAYVIACIQEEAENKSGLNGEEFEIDNQQIRSDPLMQHEIHTQIALYEYISSSKLDAQTIQELRRDIIAEGVSSLGIQY